MTQTTTSASNTEPVISQVPDAQETGTQSEPSAKVDPFKLKRLQERMRDEQNLSAGILGGAAAAAIGAGVWSLITVLTSFQIGWMAVGIGFLVGWAVRRFGQGIDRRYGYIGAALSLLGCLAGNLLSVCAMVASQENMAITDVMSQLTPGTVVGILVATFHPMDALFYGIAIYWGYRYSFRRLTEHDVAGITT